MAGYASISCYRQLNTEVISLLRIFFCGIKHSVQRPDEITQEVALSLMSFTGFRIQHQVDAEKVLAFLRLT